MKQVSNFVPALAALAWLGECWWLAVNPQNFLAIGGAMAVFCFVAAWLISAHQEKKWWNAALLPLVTNTVVLGYTIISGSQVLINILIAVLLVLNYIYWRFVYFYYNRPSKYTSFSLENLSFYVNFLSVFFLGALAYGIRAFLQYNFWLILAGVAVALALVLYQGMWAAKVDWQKYGWYLPVHLIVLLEFFGVLSLLPLDHNLLGFLWASTYYLLLILFNDLMGQRFSHKRLRFYIAVVAAAWLVLLFSATWL